MIEFINEHNIDIIIDASHPYATEASKKGKATL